MSRTLRLRARLTARRTNRTLTATVEVETVAAPQKVKNPDYRAFTIRVPVALYDQLNERAARRGVSVNYEANEVVVLGLAARGLSSDLIKKHLL